MKIAVTNQKGGVGKTTLAINVSAALTLLDQEVLLIDMDPQGHATEGVGLAESYENTGETLRNLLLETRGDKQQEILSSIIKKGEEFDVIPSNVDMHTVDKDLNGEPKALERLNNALQEVPYDYVIMDSPPSLNHLTDNAVLASDGLIVPVQAEQTSFRALELLRDQLDTFRDLYDREIPVLALVANLVMPDGTAREMMETFREVFGSRMPVFEIRKRVALKRAWSEGVSIFKHDEDSDMEEIFMDIAETIEEG